MSRLSGIFFCAFIYLFASPLSFGSDLPDGMLYDLRCDNLVDPLAIDSTSPHFSWKIKASESGFAQRRYRILAASEPGLLEPSKADLWDTGEVVSGKSIFVPYTGKRLAARSITYWKVGVRDGDGRSAWSAPARFGVGLLAASDWKARYITLPEQADQSRTPLLRKSFDWKQSDRILLLHVNSLGYHEVWLNGRKADDRVLAPAVSQFDKRSMADTYDLTGLLRDGPNDLVLWLGRGWYNPGLPGCVSPTPVVRAQLEEVGPAGGTILLATDTSWLGKGSEYSDTGTWKSSRFGGEIVDARKKLPDLSRASLDGAVWHPVEAVEIPEHTVSPQMVQPNKVVKTFQAISVQKIEENAWLVDMGTNLAGWTEIRFPDMESGREITLKYSDYRDPRGAVADQPQEDRYIASGGGNEVFCNKFNYHGYRYVTISNLPSAIKPEDVTGKLIRTDFDDASSFACSDRDINAIHDMMQYTLGCLSLGGYLVDCPQYERLGYGGDGNSSLLTAQTMYDLSPLYYHWLLAWEDVMREGGSLPHIAPCPQSAGGGPYWCAFIITASWETYRNYGDLRAMNMHYPAMKRWLSYVEAHSVDGLLKPWPNTEYRNWYLGDWATPKGIDQTLEPTVSLVGNCVVVWSYDTMEKIATVLGRPEDVKKFAAKKAGLKKRIHETFFDSETNGYATGTQIDLAFPMLLGVTPESAIPSVRERLLTVTESKYAGHLACGLVGLPVLTEWAVKDGAVEFMYSMLKKRDYPGFLYMLDRGATTTWEHWNGERSRIHNCYNSLGPWFYGAVGGILPADDAIAYERFTVNPRIPSGITWAKTSKETPYGTIRFDWKTVRKDLVTDLTVPPGTKATFIFPPGVGHYRCNETEHSLDSDRSDVELAPGRYSISCRKER